jgi:hypothetical protein
MESIRDLRGLIEAPADFFRVLRRKQLLPHYRGCGKFPRRHRMRIVTSAVFLG